MRTTWNQSERRHAAHWLMRALFGVSLMLVSSLAAVQQRAAAFEEECEILEMRYESGQVGVRASSIRRSRCGRQIAAIVANRSVGAHPDAWLHTEPLTGHRLSNGQIAPLVC